MRRRLYRRRLRRGLHRRGRRLRRGLHRRRSRLRRGRRDRRGTSRRRSPRGVGRRSLLTGCGLESGLGRSLRSLVRSAHGFVRLTLLALLFALTSFFCLVFDLLNRRYPGVKLTGGPATRGSILLDRIHRSVVGLHVVAIQHREITPRFGVLAVELERDFVLLFRVFKPTETTIADAQVNVDTRIFGRGCCSALPERRSVIISPIIEVVGTKKL